MRLTRARTTSSSGSVTGDLRYGYDAVGNRTSDTVRVNGLLGPSDVTTASVFNPADQLTSRGTVTYSYDANGNQIGSSAGAALAYNPADQTTSLKKAGGTVLPATYAGLSQVQRASAGATTFTNTLLGVSAGTDAYTRDPTGSLVGIRGANRSYYLTDGLGSVVALTNASGSVTNSYAYDPFGVTTETKAFLTNVFNPWRYTGAYQDATTGLYKIGARYYQPELGRWTQRDPSGLEANAYAYVSGNPVNFVDPSGLFFEFIANVADTFDTFRDLVESGQIKEGLRPFADDLAGVASGLFTTAACEFVLGLLGVPTAFIVNIIGSGVCATLGVGVGEVVQESIGNG